ncbi:MAG: NADPH:quinone oxidoreductase family protein [Alphaproteobacteria bacterium]|jgi:NADPH2:quinone reductase
MKALLCRELGSIDNLEIGEVPSPPMGAGQVRVGVKAAGVNFPDILMAEGKYQVKPDLPFIPGLEVAGEVLECADGVTHVKPGDRVMAFARRGGGYGSEVVLPAGIVTPIPDSMDFVTAAAFPVAYGTAHFALTHRGKLQAGETLLVLGATGGVGIAAIEIGKMLGARVIAAASSAEKLAIAKEHGADAGIDYRTESLRDRVKELTDGKGADVVFDPVGGDAFTQSVRCIAWEGRILVIGFASGDIPKVATNMILVKNFSTVGVVFGEHSWRYPDESRDRLTSIIPEVAAGRLNPRVWKAYPLAEATTALRAIQDRQVIGKMVLTL